MRFTWDEQKAIQNFRKHRIRFETATAVFDDPLHYSRFDREMDGEERWQTIGMIDGVAVVLVVHTLSYEGEEEWVRMISARKAEAYERRLYENGDL